MYLDVIKKSFKNIYEEMLENKDYLIELDGKFGDGDLGLSMTDGFKGILDYLDKIKKVDNYAKLFHELSIVFNESAPSSLGTILSYYLMGLARNLKNVEFNRENLINASEKALEFLKSKVNSKVGQKTIIDSIEPGIIELIKSKDINKATLMAKQGMEDTKNMIAVHGRASYHKEKTLGLCDGGACVGYLIFKGLSK